MAVAELQAPSKSGWMFADRSGVCATTLSAVENARTRKRKVSTPYYAVSEGVVSYSVTIVAQVPAVTSLCEKWS